MKCDLVLALILQVLPLSVICASNYSCPFLTCPVRFLTLPPLGATGAHMSSFVCNGAFGLIHFIVEARRLHYLFSLYLYRAGLDGAEPRLYGVPSSSPRSNVLSEFH